MIVVDTNIIVHTILRTDKNHQAELALSKDSEWAVPLLWQSEFRNVLVVHLRRKMISLEDAKHAIQHAMILIGEKEFEVKSGQILDLANTSKCSAYDCEFIAVAQNLNTRLLTEDKQILEQFPNIAIKLDDFLGGQ